MSRKLVIGGVVAAVAVAVAVFVLSRDDAASFDPAAFLTITEGDSEESVLDKLGEPDERQTAEELLDSQGIDPAPLEEFEDELSFLEKELLYWGYGGQAYVVEVEDGTVTDRNDPVPCEKADTFC